MLDITRRPWPLITAMGILWAVVAITLAMSLRQNQGHLVYVLDDPYIHMAIAKNFALNGVWGITGYSFASSSSSLLWTLLLSSVYFVFGTNEVTPFILNVLFGTLICILIYVLLTKQKLRAVVTFVALLLVIFLTPLPALIFTGQEHTLHALITILFVYLSARVLSERRPTRLESSSLLALAPLLTMARYEGLFLLLVVGCLFLAKRKPLYASSLAGLGVFPIAAYGLVSVAQGWHFLPSSVLLKGQVPDLSSLLGVLEFVGYSGYRQLLQSPHILMLVLAALAVFYLQYRPQKEMWTVSGMTVSIFVATTGLHMQFARTDWFYRYEAYLVGLGLFAIFLSLRGYPPRRLQMEIDRKSIPQYVALGLLIVLVILPLVRRGAVSLAKIPRATTNIYEQQYQMGLFVREFYQGQTIAANDVGAINYLADIKCLDLWGLGDLEVARAMRGGYYDSHRIYQLAISRDTRIAIVYDELFERYGRIPWQWTKVGQWTISNNVGGGYDTVSFYAVDPSEVDVLARNLRSFSLRLPGDVLQEQVGVIGGWHLSLGLG